MSDTGKKASTEEIRARFDKDVERFSNLETGQNTTIDAALTMELCTEAARMSTPGACELLDIGAGAGNYTLKMLEKLPGLNCTLIDLSAPMLQRAMERIRPRAGGSVTPIQGDMQELELPREHFDIVLAAATLHHLRDQGAWERMFQKVFHALKPGGSFWISDLITHDNQAIDRMFQDQYAEYLDELGGSAYRKHVLEYIAYEDTPRSLNYQLELLKAVGFTHTEVLHKTMCFAAFGAVKS